ncbi:fimbrial protein [Pseudomonas chlororaphis]|uniref:fimbrial protein n=1 Tax=Pseudomonas chlororaphis TaxID=587753 RepID=UPI0009BB2359|nr:fimbrial protein [Pseudomonas chlororaphis]
MAKISAFLVFLLFGNIAFAACVTAPSTLEVIRFPGSVSSIVTRHVAVGSSMYEHIQGRSTSGRVGNCDRQTPVEFVIDDSSMVPGSGPARYKTNVEGVEVQIGFSFFPNSTDVHVAGPYKAIVDPGSSLFIPTTMVIKFIRTGSQIARKGVIDINYSASLNVNGSPLVIFDARNVKLNFSQDIYMMACATATHPVTVLMGTTNTVVIASDRAPSKRMAFEAKCSGSLGATSPVRVYFDGDVTPDGLLRINREGEPGSATGVAIAVLDARGNKLPFKDRAKSIGLTWLRGNDLEAYYGFEGTARYVPNGKTLKPGRADASLIYVLDYN